MSQPVTEPVPSTAPAGQVPQQPDPLAEWPAPPREAPDLTSAPYLLPSAAVPGAVAVELYESDLAASVPYDSYVQTFVGPDSVEYVAIRTVPDGATSPLGSSDPLSVPGWVEGTVTGNDLGSTVTLRSPSGRVEVMVFGGPHPSETAVKLAGGLIRRTSPQAGWEVSVDADSVLQPLGEGWSGPYVQRGVEWLAGDAGPLVRLTITVGQPLVLDSRVATAPVVAGEIGGSPALGQIIPDRGSLVAWAPSPSVTITAISRGSISDTLTFASTVQMVDQTEWASAGVMLPPVRERGCDFFLDPPC